MTNVDKNIVNAELNPNVKKVSYDRSHLKTRIVHLGFGAFHRAHQALFNDELAASHNSDWGQCVVKLFSGADEISALRAQDHLYTVVEKGAEQTDVKVIGVVRESLHPQLDGIDAVLEKMAEPDVAIISLTITEKGYCVDPATGRLDKDNALIAHDLLDPAHPQSAIGYLVQALQIRRERGLGGFSVMSCDNVPENGQLVRQVVLDFAAQRDPELADWIGTHASFPCTMVDRIVPAATADSLAEITELLGVADPCAIACEPFRQWVIEDHFVAGRPQWERVGAELVQDVVPFEEMKLRMLNGSHSFLAYLGYLGGYQHIDETMTDAHYRRAALALMTQEQAPTLNMPAGTDLTAYAEMLIERFANPNLKHRTWQIAMDGSQKLPQRLLQPVRTHLQRGTDFPHLALGVAGWMRYVSGVDEQGQAIDVRDPMAAQLKTICDQHGLNISVVPALAGVEAIFGTDLAAEPQFIDAVTQAYTRLMTDGARAAVAAL
ncbi:mannitol dehydrogenase family protein [Oceanisphaera arctica]|uniref:Fructuronate reductase n=1 Tax=Oceanisphaera arctica TaxID=641510 RepID=A0A2P5TJ62_9GAMM|nr:fructuronate reductase [Oceanisphaera arctica]PPL14896.1 fructuronate reductase [Oceanisphaera arctica]GHA29598.1 D-mannonate oxidoreductase [Oceanisphaera arctica]